MKVKFRNPKLSNFNLQRVETINTILEEYQEESYTLTLRQLYYQLVSRDIIPNNDKEYSKLSRILKEARLGGLVDWDAIEDRVRKPSYAYYVLDVKDAIQDTIDAYRLDRMRDQPINVEVWIEKDALSSLISRVTKAPGTP